MCVQLILFCCGCVPGTSGHDPWLTAGGWAAAWPERTLFLAAKGPERTPMSLCFCKHLAFSQVRAGGAQTAGKVGRERWFSFLRFEGVSAAYRAGCMVSAGQAWWSRCRNKGLHGLEVHCGTAAPGRGLPPRVSERLKEFQVYYHIPSSEPKS